MLSAEKSRPHSNSWLGCLVTRGPVFFFSSSPAEPRTSHADRQTSITRLVGTQLFTRVSISYSAAITLRGLLVKLRPSTVPKLTSTGCLLGCLGLLGANTAGSSVAIGRESAACGKSRRISRSRRVVNLRAPAAPEGRCLPGGLKIAPAPVSPCAATVGRGRKCRKRLLSRASAHLTVISHFCLIYGLALHWPPYSRILK